MIKTLQLWKSDLARVRDDKELAKLPELEQKKWHAFRAEAAALLKSAKKS